MRLWLSKKSDVPLREQLATQFMLGIVSGDLSVGERLPSTRELARRFRIHSNTVSAAYRELARRGWVEFRKGSGVYVRERAAGALLDGELKLDHLIAAFLQMARARGYALSEIQTRLKHLLEIQTPDHFLLIEPDEELRRILKAEIEEATGARVVCVGLKELENAFILTGAAPVALYAQAGSVRKALPSDAACLLLHSRSVPESLQGEQRPAPDELIVVASRWPEFLRWARILLVAAGLDAAALNFRDARAPDWKKGLRASTFVITDALTARELPAGCRPHVFRIIADSSLEELRGFTL
ncbi:MAG: GntR family transcriptional regulator [Pyrinomonadaceae bacterium]